MEEVSSPGDSHPKMPGSVFSFLFSLPSPIKTVPFNLLWLVGLRGQPHLSAPSSERLTKFMSYQKKPFFQVKSPKRQGVAGKAGSENIQSRRAMVSFLSDTD